MNHYREVDEPLKIGHSSIGDADRVSEADLLAWAGTVAGGRVTGAKRIAGGNRRRAMLVDIVQPSGDVVEAFLRFSPESGAPTADPYTLRREASVYRALAGRGISLPAIIAAHPCGNAVLLERVPGDASFAQLAERERIEVTEDFVVALANLHKLDSSSLDLPELGCPRTRHAAVESELRIWRAMYDEAGRPEPLITFALRWLTENRPASEEPPVLVHGDAGPGNFLVHRGRMRALLDWELAHFGEPIEDLAWTSFRATIQPLPNFEAFLMRYEQLSGRRIDRHILRYHRIFVATRVLIVRHRDIGEMAASSDAANSLISLAINRRAAVTEIAAAANHPLPTVPLLEPPPGVDTRLYDFIIETTRSEIAPRSSDPLVLAKTRSVVRAAKYLRECAKLGEVAKKADRADLEHFLGAGADEEALVASITRGDLSDEVALDVLWRRVAREDQLFSPSLGVLAGRDYPPI